MALVSQSTKTALRTQFEVLADLLSSVDNRLSSILKDLGLLFVGDANATLVYLNKALKDIPRFEKTKTNPESATKASPDDEVRHYLESYTGLAKKEIPGLVELIATVEKDKGKVDEIAQSYNGYLNNPNRFWASFSQPNPGDRIKQTVDAITHLTDSSPLARRLLCRRLSEDVTTKAEQLEKQGATLRSGLSYRKLALRLSLGEDWQKHRSKLQEGDKWVELDPGVLPGIKDTNWKRWSRTTKAGIRAINDYLKTSRETTSYWEISASIRAIQNCYGSTPHNPTTPLPFPTQTDSRESAHLMSAPISAPHTRDNQTVCTKRRRTCERADEVPQNSQQTNKRRHHVQHEPQRVDKDTDAIEISSQRVLEPGERRNILSEQEGPSTALCEANGSSQELYQRISDTVSVPQTALPDATRHTPQNPTFDTLGFGPRYSQDPLLQEAAQGSIGDGIPFSLLPSQNHVDQELTSWNTFPNSDSDLCWSFPNFESGWTHGTWLSPFSNSDPNLYTF